MGAIKGKSILQYEPKIFKIFAIQGKKLKRNVQASWYPNALTSNFVKSNTHVEKFCLSYNKKIYNNS